MSRSHNRSLLFAFLICSLEQALHLIGDLQLSGVAAPEESSGVAATICHSESVLKLLIWGSHEFDQ